MSFSIDEIDFTIFEHFLPMCQDRFRQKHNSLWEEAGLAMKNEKKAPTIQDVARVASVSAATVSRALSTPDRVSDAMRDKVSAAILSTGYTLNQAARTLRKRASKTILVILPDIGNTFFSNIVNAVEREAAARGYGMLVTNRIGGRDPSRKVHEFILSNRADGLLVCDGSLDLSDFPAVDDGATKIPVVIACEEHPGFPAPTVVTDNIRAAQLGVQHLIDLGHRRIGHISSPRNNVLFSLRRAGYEQAMQAAGLPIQAELTFEGSFSLESGAQGAQKLLSLPEPPTAIFCDNDEMAIGLISEAHKMDVACPADLSVCGFDDIAVASRVTPPLTTLRQPNYDVGRIAAEILLDTIEHNPSGQWPQRVVLKSELIIRGSTASPRQIDVK